MPRSQPAGQAKSDSVSITGSDSSSAQEITCQPPSRRDSAAPSA